MDLDQLFSDEFDNHARVLGETRTELAAPFVALCKMAVEAVQAGGKIVFFGNGGSAADAQHLATELTVRYLKNRAPIAAISLSTDTSTLTAVGNDLGFDLIFARQIEALCKPQDLVIGISTSGNSENVIKAFAQARAIGCKTAAFGGKDGGRMAAENGENNTVDQFLIVPSNDTPRIQEMHILLGHLLCDGLERELGLV